MTFQEIRERANCVRGIPLQSVLLETGAQQDRYDKAKWHTAQGAVSCTGMKFINWHQNTGGGGAIDLAMHLNNIGFKAAVEWLWNRFPNCDRQVSLQPFGASKLILPPRDRNRNPAVIRYLIDDRALPASLIQSLIKSGRIYADNRGNVVFLLLGKENNPVGAEIRGTTAARWRGMAPGSRKDLGYFSVPNPGAITAVLCESAIDAISCFVLYPTYLCISTSGVRSNPRWLSSLINQGVEIYCGYDSDSPGDNMAKAMIGLFPEVKRLRPGQNDWNDVLRNHSARPSV
jgi:hypothetical protein